MVAVGGLSGNLNEALMYVEPPSYLCPFNMLKGGSFSGYFLIVAFFLKNGVYYFLVGTPYSASGYSFHSLSPIFVMHLLIAFDLQKAWVGLGTFL